MDNIGKDLRRCWLDPHPSTLELDTNLASTS